MIRCSNLIVTRDTTTGGVAAPGILTAKALQDVLRQQKDEEEEDIISPYGRFPRHGRKTRYKNRMSDSVLPQTSFRHKQDVRRKRCRKLDPMPATMTRVAAPDNQTSCGENRLEAPDEQQLEQLRCGLQQASSKRQQDADRLKGEIQWIHGHFPVLKLANAKCSRTLRQQLFRNAVVHVSINFMLRKALLVWHKKLLEARRKERLQLSASRQLITMFEKISFERVAAKFEFWRDWMLECQNQENMAAAITLQRFSRFLHSRRKERESTERDAQLMKALQELSRNASTIQRVYRRHRLVVQTRQCEAAARKIQRVEMRRTAHTGFVKRQNAANVLQQAYRAHSKRRSHKRARAIAHLFDRSREKNARCIQHAWRGFRSWRDCDLPVEIVQNLVDQVEFLGAVLVIQRYLRGFQCRLRLRRKDSSAVRIQNCWQKYKRRAASRADRRMLQLHQNLAAFCLQRTFRRLKEERKVRSIVRQATCPLYLKAQHLGDSFREQFRVLIAKSAIVVIQTTWRRYVAYKKEKQRKLVAAMTIRKFLKRGANLSKWRSTVFGISRCRRDEAAWVIQRWIRRLHKSSTNSTRAGIPVVYLMEQISAATDIQRWFRQRRSDMWRPILSRLLAKELPRCVEAANRIWRCWKTYCARKQEQFLQASRLADLVQHQRRTEVENRGARFIQRMFKRMIDRREGKLLLRRFKILLREDIKRRQQRAIVHKYLEEKSQQRKIKQEMKSIAAARRVSVNSSTGTPQAFSLDSFTMEDSAFSLDETTTYTSAEQYQEQDTNSTSPQPDGPVQYWSDEYQCAYLYDSVTGVSTWL